MEGASKHTIYLAKSSTEPVNINNYIMHAHYFSQQTAFTYWYVSILKSSVSHLAMSDSLRPHIDSPSHICGYLYLTYLLQKLRVPILLSFHHPLSSKEKRYLHLKNIASLNNARSLRACSSTSLSLYLYFFPSYFYVIPGVRLDLQY